MDEIEEMVNNLVASCIDYGRFDETCYSDVEYKVEDLLELIKSKLKEGSNARY